MRRHTIIGERILDGAPALSAAARLVRSSHERFDGKGYPDQLAGANIPLGARIVAVCDAYDAMVSDRPYRRALPSEEAIHEITRCAGTQFDPAVVEAFAIALARPTADEIGELAVLPLEVVNAANGWSVAEAAVWPPAVVVAQERCQGAVSGVVVGPGLGLSPFAVEGLDEALDLAVPARCPGWDEDVVRLVAGERVGERA